MAGVNDSGPALSGPTPGAVLFACNFNRVRSAMAEHMAKRLYGHAMFVDSVGLHAHSRRAPSEDTPDPFVVAAMDELGIDMTRHRPKSFDDLEDTSFDVVISLTPEAHHRGLELSRGRAIDVEYWPTMDPTLVNGQREQMLQAYRDVRDALERRIQARFGQVRTFGG